MPTWPATLPQEFEARDYEEAPGAPVRRTQIGRGWNRRSRVSNRRASEAAVVADMLMDARQWRALENFYGETTGQGFEFPNLGFVTFSAAPELRHIGGDLNRVTLTLEKERN